MTAPLLTLVTNRATSRHALPDLARMAVDGGVDMVQVRERDLQPIQLHALLTDVVAAVGADRVAVNDAPEIATTLGIHLHLPERSSAGFSGREDRRAVSCSIHSVASLASLQVDVSYVVAGHLFPTMTHPDSPPLGVDGMREIVLASAWPVVAIGGISPSNLCKAIEAGATGVAVMSYVKSSAEPRLAARELRDALERSMNKQALAISIQVNGKPMSLEPETTVMSFLERRNLHPRLVVVERNREIVAKSAYDSTVLEQGDLLEIAHFVGGG